MQSRQFLISQGKPQYQTLSIHLSVEVAALGGIYVY